MSKPVVLLDQILSRIDQINAADPRMDDSSVGEEPIAKELLYGQRMSARLARFEPEASEELQIACRGQHIARWHWPRTEFPPGRAGYKQWRRELYQLHASAVSEIMEELGYDERKRARVESLICKRNRATDNEAQSLEDVACLVFLEFEFSRFAAKHERAKVIRVVKKTWQKMSERGQNSALQLKLADEHRSLLEEALS